MRTRASVERKWAEKLESIRLKADFKFNILAQNKRKKFDRDLEYQLEKLERKKASYLSKKEKEYRKKMLNEIREIE